MSDEKTKDENAAKLSELEDTKFSKQLEDSVRVFKTLKELSYNPIQNAIESKVGELAMGVIQEVLSKPTAFRDQFQEQIAKNPSLQKMVAEYMFCQPKEQEKSNPNTTTRHKDEDIPIHEKLSPEDVYIIRIVGDELEVAENHDGVVVYKRIKLAS